MSLFIKGVFMPKEGESRTFNLQNGIIEILSPHGRLIDADKLIEYLRKNLGDTDIGNILQCVVDCQPTIIEAEVSE